MENITKIGIFGGSFDPPTIAHQMVVQAVYAETDLDEIWICPTLNHPNKDNKTDFNTRLVMSIYAFSNLGFNVADYERCSDGTTIDFLEQLSKKHYDKNFSYILILLCKILINITKFYKMTDFLSF